MRLIPLIALCWSLQVFAEEYPVIHLPIGPNSPASSVNTYIDRENGFGVVIPDGWKRDSTEGYNASLVVSDPSRFKKRCLVHSTIMKRAKDLTIEQKVSFYSQLPGDTLTSYGNPELSRQGLTPIANDFGMLVEFSYLESGSTFKQFVISLLHNNGLLLVICSDDIKTYKDSLSEFGVFVNSVVLIN